MARFTPKLTRAAVRVSVPLWPENPNIALAAIDTMCLIARRGAAPCFAAMKDYAAFEQVMLDAFERVPLRIIGWCLLQNHWHFLVWPHTDDEVTAYFRAVAHTHAMRRGVTHRSAGDCLR